MNGLNSSHTPHECGELCEQPSQFNENGGIAAVCGAGKNCKIPQVKLVSWVSILGRSVEVCPTRLEKNKGAGFAPGTLTGTEMLISSSGFTNTLESHHSLNIEPIGIR
jgi:hypothetical protein